MESTLAEYDNPMYGLDTVSASADVGHVGAAGAAGGVAVYGVGGAGVEEMQSTFEARSPYDESFEDTMVWD
jgi:hypothetical protein